MRLDGKRILATASGQGIGRACVEAFAREGAKVYATDINADLLRDFHGDIEPYELNVLDKDALEKTVARVRPNVLFNCAGIVHNGTILDATDDEFDFAMSLNVKAQFHSMRAAIPIMIEDGGGTIVNIASVASSILAAPNRCIYGASKAAVLGLTKSVAVDFVTQGIRANAICPGTVDSPSLHQRLRDTGDYDTALTNFIARQPMGRIASAEEVAHMAVYLASDESAFVTGQAFVIDGGWAAA